MTLIKPEVATSIIAKRMASKQAGLSFSMFDVLQNLRLGWGVFKKKRGTK